MSSEWGHMEKKYVIAHLSDLHITARDDDSRYEMSLPHERLKGMNDAFKSLLASRLIQAADHIVITGDITDKGDLKAWKKFQGYLRNAKLEQKTSFIIGNHDICDLGIIKWGFTRKHKWDRIKRVRTNLKRRLAAIDSTYNYPWVKMLRDDIVLFGIDSNNAASTSDASNAVGEIGQKQLSSFASHLRKHADIPVKIVALHHSPNLAEKAKRVQHKSWFSRKYTRVTHQIPKGQRRCLRLLCKSHGVKRLIHGHMHEKDDRTLDVRIVGVPSSTQPVVDGAEAYLSYIEYHITTTTKGDKRVRNIWRMLPIVPTFEKISFAKYVLGRLKEAIF